MPYSASKVSISPNKLHRVIKNSFNGANNNDNNCSSKTNDINICDDLLQLKEKIVQLVELYPRGVPLDEIYNEFERKFLFKMDYAKFKYKNVSCLLSDITSIQLKKFVDQIGEQDIGSSEFTLVCLKEGEFLKVLFSLPAEMYLIKK